MDHENTEQPIWEQALKEISGTRREVVETMRAIVDTRRQLSKRLDRIAAIAYQNRADLRDVQDRIDELESKPV